MDSSSRWIVVTTINYPTKAIHRLSELGSKGWNVVVVADLKTPVDWEMPNVYFLSTDEQKEIYGKFSGLIPYNHYCRKNLGYLYAIENGATCILETDDDNIPYDAFGQSVAKLVKGRYFSREGWSNPYQYFTSQLIWPRGLPLDEINSIGSHTLDKNLPVVEKECVVQQFLADSDPDVDAIYRLIFNNEVNFNQNELPLILAPNCWTAFNSQNTLFFREAFATLYLPCFVSFRMTDIWRSFVSQSALWLHDEQVAFLGATVKQERNDHDLMHDFEDEIPGYRFNRSICESLESELASLKENGNNLSMGEAVFRFWKRLSDDGFIEIQELKLVEDWLDLLEAAL